MDLWNLPKHKKMRNKTIHYLILLLLLIATYVKTQSLFANERQHFQFIDLGLSVDWSTCNLGAVTPEGFGNYFAFGELLPKQQFTKDNYKYSKIVLGDIQGNPLYDVAASLDIFLCRIPKSEEWEELINNCVWSETIENGIKGQRITGPNGNSIFIPLSGWYDSRPQINDVGNYGRYWTSESTDDMANFVYIGSWERGISENPRYMGYSIRIVRAKVNTDDKLHDSCHHPDLPIDSVMPKKKKELPDSCHHPDLPSFEFEAATPASGSVLNRLDEIVVDFATESVLTGSAEVDVVGAGVKATFAPTANAGQVKAVLSQAVTAEGDYSITIPEGVFTAADGTINEAVTLNYTVEYPEMDPSQIVVSPADGDNVVGLNTITIEFPEPITINENAGQLTLSNGATIQSVELEKYTARITAVAPAGWQVGEYTLNVPKGYFVSESSKNPALSYSWNIIAATLSIDDFMIYSGETKEVAVKLTGGVDFTAFQADVRLPEGLEFVGDVVLNRGADHVISSRVQKDGAIRLLSYSLTNKNYTGNSGDALVTFKVKATADYNATRQMTIDGIIFTTSAGVEYELLPVSATIRIRISSIEISPAALNLETGETAKVSAIVLPKTTYEKKFEWSSSNKDIVEVDYDGNVTVNAIGEAAIIATVTDGSGVTAQIPVTVVYTHATALAIDPASVSLEADQRQVLTVVLDKETNKADDVVWSSDNEAVAVVEITEGVVEVVAKSFGDANITAQIKNGEEVVLTNTIAVKVSATVAQTVTVEPAELTLESGHKFTFTATVNEEATNKAVVWSSSAPEIVTVDAATGEVTALALTEEPIIITATAADGGGAFGTARVTVVQSPRKSDIHICPDENHPHAIDLGLPSGTKWSCCNIGAKHPEDSGDSFAWGETESKDEFSDKNYSLKGKNIGNEISETQCDAAYINWGNEWCTPTVKQLQELLEYCSTESVDCASGVLFTGPNGKKLFLPYFKDNTEDFGIGIYMSGSHSDHIEYLGPHMHIEYTKSLFLFDLPNESNNLSKEEKRQLSFLRTLAKIGDGTYGQKIIDWLKIARQIIKPVKSNNN